MAALTTYASNAILDKLLRNSGTFPTSWYYALFTTIETDAETATECTDANYARQLITFGTAASSASIGNSAVITVPGMAVNQSILAVGIADALTAGHVWIFENLSLGITLYAGVNTTVPINNLITTAV